MQKQNNSSLSFPSFSSRCDSECYTSPTFLLHENYQSGRLVDRRLGHFRHFSSSRQFVKSGCTSVRKFVTGSTTTLIVPNLIALKEFSEVKSYKFTIVRCQDFFLGLVLQLINDILDLYKVN
ncbi:uncharacterized protein [Spinacia oleracea]|uniref:Uncharacterized protein isoform X3 n=1 Tax=Spinacia oleracea TaxID=3562 RepID=A0A9R0J8Z5_SPIOL|nr:uncharacterized protein LOC110801201 isoform X3 [Spinacia oleracea]